MTYDSDLMLTNASARRMLDSISPIYGRARNFLAILDALGSQTQQINDWAEQLNLQALPQTADWALYLWEDEYALRSGGMGEDARRAQLLSRVRMVGSANPHAICSRAGAAVGCSVRAVENTGKNHFTLYAKRYAVDEDALRAAVDAIKPAHLNYQVKCEQDAPARASVTCGLRWARTYALNQSN